jgi:hypothetical protein
MANERPKTVSDYQAEFFESQRQQANTFNSMVQEVLALNQILAKTVAERDALLAESKTQATA